MEQPRIITNHHWHPILDAEELTPKQRADVVWADDTDPVFVYRGQPYSLDDFTSTSFVHSPDWMRAWEGYSSDSFFSGILIRINADRDCVQVATYIT